MPVGIVSVVFGARCEVLDQGQSVPCLLRGKLKLGASLAVGDRVEYARLGTGEGVVERVLERRNQLTRSSRERPRRRRTPRGPAESVALEQVVIANPDQVVFVAAARNPGLNFPLLDRALSLARGAELPAVICVNKMDLAPEADLVRLMRPYERLGVPVIYASAEDGRGLDALRPLLKDRLSFFWGGSGVGKSSLIRVLTGNDVKVERWRIDNPRGPHTTNVTRLYPLPFGGLIADTPGFDWLELDTVEGAPDRVSVLLPEATALSLACRFPGCSHCGEPDCAVMAAVVAGEIDRSRYARFRACVAELQPAPSLPIEVHSTGEELFFRMREGNTSTWTTFHFYYLFQQARPERDGLLGALAVLPTDGQLCWIVFQEQSAAGGDARSLLTAKVTSLEPVERLVQVGQELILRERSVVKGIGVIRELRPVTDTWRLRKPLKGTPIYDARAFWSDLKPPPGEPLPHVYSALLSIGSLVRFEKIAGLALGALTQQGASLALDYLEVGSSEDELARE